MFLWLRDSHGLQWVDLASEVLHPGADQEAQRQQNWVFELFCSLTRCSQRARAMVGELHWLTTQTRVDLDTMLESLHDFSIADRRLLFFVNGSRCMSRPPRTTDFTTKGFWGRKLWPRRWPQVSQRCSKYRSVLRCLLCTIGGTVQGVQGTLVSIAGCPVTWSSSRQT